MKGSFQTRLNSFYRWGAMLLVLISSLLIFFSSLRQSVTVDEPNHIYCGMEFLQYGTYKAWPENPPLSRIVTAVGPYISQYKIDKVPEGGKKLNQYFSDSYNLDYFSGGGIQKKLLWARILVLPMFLISAWVVWVWAQRLGGAATGFLAIGMYATLPPVIAQSSLATTDVTFMAAFLILLHLFFSWLKKPSIPNGCWLGIGLAASLLTKYSILIFFPVAAAVAFGSFLFYRRSESELGSTTRQWLIDLLKSATVAIAISAVLVWALYSFSFGTLAEQPVIAAGIKEGKIQTRFAELAVPAPEWFAGLKLLLLHNEKGHRAYLLGNISQFGFIVFYPIALLLKTTLPFLLFSLLGLAGGWIPPKGKSNWELKALTLIPFFIVLSVMTGRLNLGLRHILIVYPLFAICCSVGICNLAAHFNTTVSKWTILVLPALILWQLIICLFIFPNYISFFNLFAGREPGAYITGSDLDRGQGLFELSQFSRKHNIDTLNLAYYGIAKDCWYPLPNLRFMADTAKPRGWVAISEALYRGVWIGKIAKEDSCNLYTYMSKSNTILTLNKSYRWLDKYPLVAKVGGSLRVYHIP